MTKIVEIRADELTIPYPRKVRPAWQPGRSLESFDFTLVRIFTDDGVMGITGTAGHVARLVLGEVRPFIIGQSPFAVEKIARIFKTAGHGVWCIDAAIWDIIGKISGLPLYKLWGYAWEKIPAYASSVENGSPEDRAELCLHYQELGFKFVKLRLHNETIGQDLAVLDRCIEATKGKISFMIDANQPPLGATPVKGVVWTFERALIMARELGERGIVWLEEPLDRYDFENLSRLCLSSDTPIAGGELNQGLHEFRWIIENDVYDVIQPCPILSEGVSQLRKIAGLAEMHKKRFAPHHGMSGIGLSAGLHLACTFPGETWLELMYEPETRSIESFQQLGGIIKTKVWIDSEGMASPSDLPGLGVLLDQDMIQEYSV